jgi:hypothetical protein
VDVAQWRSFDVAHDALLTALLMDLTHPTTAASTLTALTHARATVRGRDGDRESAPKAHTGGGNALAFKQPT